MKIRKYTKYFVLIPAMRKCTESVITIGLAAARTFWQHVLASLVLAQLHLGGGASDTSVTGTAGGARWGHEAIGVTALRIERPRADWNWMRRKWIW